MNMTGDVESPRLEEEVHDQLPHVEECKAGLSSSSHNHKSNRPLKSWMMPTAVWFLATVLLTSVVVCSLIGVVFLRTGHSSEEAHPSGTTTPTPNSNNNMSMEDRLRAILEQPDRDPLFAEGSYQNKALSQLQNPFYASYDDQRLAQVYALLSLYYATHDNDEAWSAAPFWAHFEYECQWEGITCDSMGRVAGMDLSNFGLNGVVPAEVALLASSLARIHLDHNPGLTGLIPSFFGRMTSLGKSLLVREGECLVNSNNVVLIVTHTHTFRSLLVVELTLTGCGYVGNMPAEICQLKLDDAAVVIEADCLAQIACNAFCCERCT
jgi:hypothetical protein